MKSLWILQNNWLNITLYDGPEGAYGIWKQFLLESSIAEYNILGENMIFADDYDHFYKITKHDLFGAGTHAVIAAALESYELAMGRWYRSKEKVAGMNPYGAYLSSKKWHLNEESRWRVRNNKFTPLIFQEMAKHLQYFQQVNCNL